MCSVSLPGGDEVSEAVLASGQTSDGDLQPADQDRTKIVGGEPAELLFLASIGTATQHICQGILVDPLYLMTTAQCAE